MTTTTHITDPIILKGNHPDAVRLIVKDYDGESWTSYLVLDRAKVCDGLRRLREQGLPRREYVRPDWPAYYGGPGRPFAHRMYRTNRNSRRFVIWGQSGGLDI